MMSHLRALLVSAPVLALAASGAAAQCQLQELIPPQLSVKDHLGYGVCVDGDVAIAGAMQSSEAGPDTGSAYVFRLVGGNWLVEQKLNASDMSSISRFGWSAAIRGNVCVVGSPHHTLATGGYEGAVYVFRHDGVSWNEETILSPSDARAGNQFGYDVTMGDEDTILVGATRSGATRHGKAYLFRFDGVTWSEDHVFAPVSGSIGDFFGTAVAIEEPIALVTAEGTLNGGRAHVYRFDGVDWVNEAILAGSDTFPGDSFGHEIGIDGDTIVVGAPQADQSASEDGSAYVFRYDGAGWPEEAKLGPSYRVDGNYFGWSVSLVGDDLAIGAVRDMQYGFEGGAAYTFRRNGTVWTESAKLVRRGIGVDQWFAGSLALGDDHLLVGGFHVDTGLTDVDSGAVTVYSHPNPSHASCYGVDSANTARLLTYGETALGGSLELIYENPSSAPANATVVISLASLDVALPPIGQVLIDPAQIVGYLRPSVSLGSLFARTTQSIPLPNDPTLLGVQVFLQGALFPNGFKYEEITEMTNGVVFTFGP